MSRKDLFQAIGVGLLTITILLMNDVIVGHRLAGYLIAHPEVISAALEARSASERSARERVLSDGVVSHWRQLAVTSAYVVQFDGHAFVSKWERVSDAASKPEQLNLIATDYRCGYCKADRIAVDELLRTHPERRFVFLEAAILGPDSVNLAERALEAARVHPDHYYSIHRQFFEEAASVSTAVSPEISAAVSKHRNVAKLIGITSTPTYILSGVPHSGMLVAETRQAGG